jgi:putative spermidine/putrescine transport system ATP-binding protein
MPAGDVDLMLRPERLRLVPNDATDSGDTNTLDMTVDDIINYGDSVLAIGKSRGLALRARIAGTRPEALRHGAVVRLAFNPEDAHILPRG